MVQSGTALSVNRLFLNEFPFHFSFRISDLPFFCQHGADIGLLRMSFFLPPLCLFYMTVQETDTSLRRAMQTSRLKK